MEKEVDPDVIKATQISLSKYVKRPPLTEKLLKKPPFRFLHDIVTTVLKTTGFFEGLFEENELTSENVKDRESKISFLSKVITVVGMTTGNNLSVKPSKIVAGQEPEKTNELLQCLAQALDKQLSSEEAVKKYKEGVKGQGDNKTTEQEAVKTVKKTNDTKKLTSRSNEKLTSNKKDAREKSISRNDKDKANVSKSKQKETVPAKKDSPPKKSLPQQTKTISKNNSIEKVPQNENETANNKNRKSSAVNNIPQKENHTISVANNATTDQDSAAIIKEQDIIDAIPQTQQLTPRADQEYQGKQNSSYRIVENDINSSLSSQDLMEVDNEEEQHESIHDGNTNAIKKQNHDNQEKHHELQRENTKTQHREENNSRPQSFTKEIDKFIPNDHIVKTDKTGNSPLVRPKSVRPSSSRPGAPRLREKHENLVSVNENILVGRVNIIVENTPNEEDEDSSILIVEQQNDTPSISHDQQDLQLSSNQHGALVQQILESQKEYSQIAGKTEIEWQFGAQKAREAVNQEIEQLRFNIQALSRVANPLGKVLDHIQEDVEVMRQELQQWTRTYEEASKELYKQKTANEDSLFPLHTKLKVLDADIREKRDKINDLKIVIHKNSSRIEKLLTGGDVQ